MSEAYEYMNEESINKDLICSICELPFNDPSYAPCGETFCHQCITRWIQRGNNSCPHCRQSLSTTALRRTPRSLRNMLDRLQVKCIACGQTEINRGNFDDHIQKVCAKTIVSCPSEDRKCPWRGQRDHIHQHLVDCRFVPMRAIITQLINENQKLLNLVNQHTTQTFEKENAMKKLLETSEQQKIQIDTHEKENQQLRDLVNQQTKEIVAQHNMIKRIAENQEQQIFQINTYRNENQHVKDQVNQQIVHIDAQQKEIRRLKEQVKQKGTQITSVSHPSVQLHCSGHSCPICQKCCDWYDPGFFSPYAKRDGATCRYEAVGFFSLFVVDDGGNEDLSVIYHLCRCEDGKNK